MKIRFFLVAVSLAIAFCQFNRNLDHFQNRFSEANTTQLFSSILQQNINATKNNENQDFLKLENLLNLNQAVTQNFVEISKESPLKRENSNSVFTKRRVLDGILLNLDLKKIQSVHTLMIA